MHTGNKNVLFLASYLVPQCNWPLAYLLWLFWKTTETTGLRRTLHPLVCTTCAILSHVTSWSESQKLWGVSEDQVPMMLTTYSHHLQWKGHTMEIMRGWLDPLLVYGKPEDHASEDLASSTVFLYNFRDAFVLTDQAEASQVLLREKLSQ